jgi:hypothetical protein
MADRLIGGLRKWRTIFDVFGGFWRFFGDFGHFFLEILRFSPKNRIYRAKNPESAIYPVRHLAFPTPPFSAPPLYSETEVG